MKKLFWPFLSLTLIIVGYVVVAHPDWVVVPPSLKAYALAGDGGYSVRAINE